MVSILLALIATLAAVQAAPAANPNCITVFRGNLVATISGETKSFTTASDGTVEFIGNGQNPLNVEFQACLPPGGTLGSGGGNGEYTGRLFVPAVKKCVNVPNQSNPAPPYTVQVSQCYESGPDDLEVTSQAFIYQTSGGNTIFFLGQTFEQGASHQGGCEYGYLGYTSDSNGNPTVSSSKAISLSCSESGSTPFHLSN